MDYVFAPHQRPATWQPALHPDVLWQTRLWRSCMLWWHQNKPPALNYTTASLDQQAKWYHDIIVASNTSNKEGQHQTWKDALTHFTDELQQLAAWYWLKQWQARAALIPISNPCQQLDPKENSKHIIADWNLQWRFPFQNVNPNLKWHQINQLYWNFWVGHSKY